NVVAAARTGQAGGRILRIADEGAVEITVLIDLRPTHESNIDIAALEKQQDIGAAEHHIGAPRAALLVGGGRELAGLDEGADRPALEEDGKAGTMQALREGGGEQWNADPGEDHLAVLQEPPRHDGKQFA